MANKHAGAGGRLPSLDAVLEEVRLERVAQLQHFDSLDSKAGILLGFAGALVALTPTETNVLVDLGRAASVVAAVFAFLAFWPRAYKLTNLRALRDLYVTADPVFTRRRILDTQISMTEETMTTLRSKGRRLKGAMASLLLAAALVAAGLVVT